MTTLSDEDKYKRPELTAGSVVAGGAIPAYLTAKAVGGGNAWQGVKNTASAVGGLAKTAGATAGAGYRIAGGVRGIAQGAKVLGGATARALPAVSAGIATAYTPTEDYYERFGFSRDGVGDSLAKDIGIRTLGYASDLGNAFTLGQAGTHLFQDKIRQHNETNKAPANTSSPQPPQPTSENKRVYAQIGEQNHPTPAENLNLQSGGVIGKSPSQQTPFAPPAPIQFQGGLKADNPNYQALLEQVARAGQAMIDSQQNQKPLGKQIYKPERGWENEAHRKDLMRQATTVHRGAHGLTAAQMRLAHDLSNDDIKLAQERYLQQNNLNHQLEQEQLQQQAQNQRAVFGETGQMARAIMGEQGQNARFNANLGLDVAKFNQDAQNTQYELGLKGADLRSRLGSQALDDSAKAEQMSLYNQYINAQDDEQRDKILTQMAVLSGKGGGDKGDSFATINLGEHYDPETQTTINRGQALYNTRTGQVVGGQNGQNNNVNWNDPKNLQAFEKELTSKKVTGEQAQAIAQKYGIPPEFIAQYFGEQQ